MLEYITRLKKQLAIDFNCSPEDFDKGENILTESVLNKGRRAYDKEAPFFGMATLGGNAVITADKRLHPFLREYMKTECGHWLFEQQRCFALERELNKYSRSLNNSHHMFLYGGKSGMREREMPAVKWYYGREEIEHFYGDTRFPNAICTEYDPERPDTIVVCAYDGDRMMGMAGCSEDAPHWQQIGIDVLPEYRSRGVASCLVKLLTEEVIRRGDIPFYGTSLANYRSWNVALNCGYRPVWVEMSSRKIAE